MRSETELNADIEKKQQVESLLNNPQYQSMFLILKAHTIESFGKLKFDEVEEMKECQRVLKTLDRIETHFNRILKNGKVAEETLLTKLKGKFK